VSGPYAIESYFPYTVVETYATVFPFLVSFAVDPDVFKVPLRISLRGVDEHRGSRTS